MLNKFQLLFNTLMEMTNTAGVSLNSTGSFGTTTDPIPNPTNGTGYSEDLRATMSLFAGKKKRKSKNKPQKANIVLPIARRSLKRTT
jgi:hypothetical protein